MNDLVSSILILLSGLFAGAINSVAGGGTLLTFPALMLAMGSVEANITSTIALFPGSLAGAWSYRQEVIRSKKMIVLLLFPSIIGGTLGGLLLIKTDEQLFNQIVPWLILLATILFLFQKPLSLWVRRFSQKQIDEEKKLFQQEQLQNKAELANSTAPDSRHHHPRLGIIVTLMLFQIVVATYGGYFGAGMGIIMLTTLAFMGIGDIHHLNGVKTILAGIINVFASGIFVFSDLVVWKYCLPMSIMAIIGGYWGARIARKLPPSYIRILVIMIGLILSAFYFYQEFKGR